VPEKLQQQQSQPDQTKMVVHHQEEMHKQGRLLSKAIKPQGDKNAFSYFPFNQALLQDTETLRKHLGASV
jgi:hypothetical protein